MLNWISGEDTSVIGCHIIRAAVVREVLYESLLSSGCRSIKHAPTVKSAQSAA